MTCHEIYTAINNRQIEALMFHDLMSDFYDFLGLQGFKCWHKYQYKTEAMEHKKTKHFYMSMHNKLLSESPQSDFNIIPDSWFGYTRMDVTPQVRKQALETSMDKYRNWEEETCSMYEECHTQAHIKIARCTNVLLKTKR